MKKIYIIIILFLFFCNINVNAVLKDGWHLLPSTTDSSKKEWAYYKNGEETLRYSKMIYVHAGWMTTPENSMASLKTLKKHGYYALSADINFTKDNIPVLIHDDTINWAARNSDLSKISETLYVKDLTLAELKKYDFVVASDGKVLSNYKGNKITTYEEALDYCKKNGLTLEVEIKAGTKSQIKSIVELTQKYNMDGVVRWTSFNGTYLKYIDEYDNNEMLQLLTFSDDYNEIDSAYNKLNLKTGKNTLLYGRDDGYYFVPELPDQQSTYYMSKYKLNTIPRGVVSISNTNISQDKKNVTVSYQYNGDGKVKCKSTDETIGTCIVDQDNKQINITIINNNAPKAIFRIMSSQGKKYSASKEIKLTIELNIQPESITLNKTSTTINVGNNETLIATISPSNASNKSISWTSNNPNVAKVNNKGVVTGVNEGTAIITATSANGIKATCTIVVKKTSSNNNIPVNRINLNKTNIQMNIGDIEKLSVVFIPSNPTNQSVSWTSSDDNIVTVDNGNIMAINEGEATITATSSNGKTATCKIIVQSDNKNIDDENTSLQTLIIIVLIIIVVFLIIINIISINNIKKRKNY